MIDPQDPTAIRVDDISARTMAKLTKAYQDCGLTTDRLPYTRELDLLAAVVGLTAAQTYHLLVTLRKSGSLIKAAKIA